MKISLFSSFFFCFVFALVFAFDFMGTIAIINICVFYDVHNFFDIHVRLNRSTVFSRRRRRRREKKKQYKMRCPHIRRKQFVIYDCYARSLILQKQKKKNQREHTYTHTEKKSLNSKSIF